MTKRQIRNAAHKSIFKDGKTHTQTFLDLRPNTDWPDNSLADLVSGIPSQQKFAETKPIWTAYLGILGAIVLLRLSFIFLLFQEFGSDMEPIILVPLVIFSIFVPALGIYAVLTGKRNSLPSIIILLILGVIRGLEKTFDYMTWDSFLFFGLLAGLIVITILLWNKWKTPYTTQVEKVATENGTQDGLRYQFEDDVPSNAELLDDSF